MKYDPDSNQSGKYTNTITMHWCISLLEQSQLNVWAKFWGLSASTRAYSMSVCI